MALPEAVRGHGARQARGLDDNLGPVVHARLGRVAEHHLVALDLEEARASETSV